MAACKSEIKQLNHTGVYFISGGNVYITPGQLVQPLLMLPKWWVDVELAVILSSHIEFLAEFSVFGWWPRTKEKTL